MNKRIQRKRDKAEMQRDKTKVIANLVVLMEPGLTRTEYLRMAKSLWKLDMDALFKMSFHVMGLQFKRAFPLIKIIPRKTYDAPTVDWRTITTDFSNTEVK